MTWIKRPLRGAHSISSARKIRALTASRMKANATAAAKTVRMTESASALRGRRSLVAGMETVQGFSNFVVFQTIEDPPHFLCLLVFALEALLGACPGFGGNHVLLVGHGLSSVIEKRAVLLCDWIKHEPFAAAWVERNQLCGAYR
ncbi:hypothetical protein [Bradyrhizobium sp. USDA 10063]